jgi:CRISPR-associated exonuclease Cas4
MLLLVLFIVIIALVLLWQARRQQQYLGLPRGKLIYADSHRWDPVEQPLYSAHLGLTGKPDYLVKHGKQIIPVEVKSSRVKQGPYDSHIFQLAAYCLLIRYVFDIRPDYGILNYPNRTYRIDYTSDLESATIDLLQEIHSQENQKDFPRSHQYPARCKGCGFFSTCDQKLIT